MNNKKVNLSAGAVDEVENGNIGKSVGKEVYSWSSSFQQPSSKLTPTTSELNAPDLVCFSHLRWDFVYQRPQHLLTRAARNRRVFFFEEPVFHNGSVSLEVREVEAGVFVAAPYLPDGLQSKIAIEVILRGIIDRLFTERNIAESVFWYYTPMALSFTHHLRPLATIYDCMDELSAFKGAPPELRALELELFHRADLVFTGGQSLYEKKSHEHPRVYPFPSSIEREHFAQARMALEEPADQREIPHPRLGFFGVLDERFDIELLDGVAHARPDWQFVIIGPVVKIDPATLPRRPNIHYLGGKKYQELPSYLASWDVALLLFARNEATRFISPTKTPEYLAAGKPVVSTSIRDVVRPYGDERLVSIADQPADFVTAAEEALAMAEDRKQLWLKRVDAFLAQTSWDQTWSRMAQLIDEVVAARRVTVGVAREAAMKIGAGGSPLGT